ncbi:hypothetical protein C5Y96_00005 [Blastopirellula marina]|uniref:Transmembrane protein n=2 Tax=Pirellulales TaxID=2691354 RepID=A0A2S8GBF9_9BACT|nr:hypothetical protein C5Y96_00005 [Blastopirellula marina]RCS56344.1 hypothetical protein DTL36_00005 [Bremerella cremea]
MQMSLPHDDDYQEDHKYLPGTPTEDVFQKTLHSVPRNIEQMFQYQNLPVVYAECVTQPLTSLEIDPQTVRSFVGVKNAESRVIQHAFATLDSDASRAHKRTTAEQGVRVIQQRLHHAEKDRQREEEVRNHRPRVEEVLSTQMELIWDLTVIPKVAKIAGWAGVFALSFLGEIKNATFLAMSSGFGFEEDWLGAFCFVLPTVLGAFTVLKYLERNLTERGRQKYIIAMNRVALPLCLVTMVLFAWSLGASHSEVDLFAAEEAADWTPPLHWLFGASMMLLALMTAMSASLLNASVVSLYRTTTRPIVLYSDTTNEMARLDANIATLSFLQSKLQAVVTQLDKERQAFAMTYLAELKRQHAALAAKQAHLGTDPLNS